MIFDSVDFIKQDSLTKCHNLQENITFVNISVIFPARISIIALIFCTKGFIEKIFFPVVCYCNKLNTNHIFLERLNQKLLS